MIPSRLVKVLASFDPVHPVDDGHMPNLTQNLLSPVELTPRCPNEFIDFRSESLIGFRLDPDHQLSINEARKKIHFIQRVEKILKIQLNRISQRIVSQHQQRLIRFRR